MTPNPTLMRQEIEEIPVAVERLLTKGTDALAAAVAVAGREGPRFVISAARGSCAKSGSWATRAPIPR